MPSLHPKPPKNFDRDAPRIPDYEMSYFPVVTPLWSEESGRRLGYARMHRLMTLEELAARLGIKRGVLSRIERGELRTSTFSVRDMQSVFSPAELEYILRNRGAAKYADESAIWGKFWAAKHGRDRTRKATEVSAAKRSGKGVKHG